MSGEKKTFGNHGQHCNDLLMQEVPWQNIEHPSCLILSERQNISTIHSDKIFVRLNSLK